MMQLLAGVLHLGNVKFDERENVRADGPVWLVARRCAPATPLYPPSPLQDSVEIKNKSQLALVASLLGVDKDTAASALAFVTTYARGGCIGAEACPPSCPPLSLL